MRAWQADGGAKPACYAVIIVTSGGMRLKVPMVNGSVCDMGWA